MVRHFFVNFDRSIDLGVKNLDWLVYNIARTGSVGVDLFFVLSGYLITGILLDTRGAPNYFRRFYVRRALRIFPLYYASLIFFFHVWPLLDMPPNISINPRSLPEGQPWVDEPWYWLYAPNILFALRGQWGGLSHYWSLAVEEQFYLIWPFLIYFVPIHRIKALCLACIATAFLLRLACALLETSIVVPYVSLPTRMDGLAIGAWLAVSAREPGGLAALLPKVKWVLVGCALGLLATIGLSFGDGRSHAANAAGGTLVAVVFGIVVLWAVGLNPRHPFPRLCCNPVLMIFGKYAYCLYVVHGPLAGTLEHFIKDDQFIGPVAGSMLPGRLIFFAICTVLSLAFALLSWNLFEKHFLKLKDRLS
jgi:peptidoglycan/LPS O-acetylase OafA/YrhL